LSEKVIAHFANVIGAESDFIEPGTGVARIGMDEFDMLQGVDDKTGVFDARATVAAGGEAQDLGLGFCSFREVAGFNADVSNAVDSCALWGLREKE
jgi:hypothetical protein